MSEYNINSFITRTVLLFLMLCPLVSIADEVKDSIKTGLDYYNDGKLHKASESFNHAAKLIQLKTRKVLEQFLPEPLAGWKSQTEDPGSIGDFMVGAGVTAERSYNIDSWKFPINVVVRIVANSPLMEGVMSMYSTPDFAAAYGKKIEIINGQKAIMDFDVSNNEGSINIVIGDKFLVQIEASYISGVKDTTRTLGVMKQYAKMIDYKNLKALQY